MAGFFTPVYSVNSLTPGFYPGRAEDSRCISSVADVTGAWQVKQTMSMLDILGTMGLPADNIQPT